MVTGGGAGDNEIVEKRANAVGHVFYVPGYQGT
jgi:hypothetical protein